MSIQLNAQKLMADKAAALIEDETEAYGRKSTKNEKATKSLSDQRDTCIDITRELHIPFDAERNWRAEEAGLGGDLWWSGGGASGLQGDTREQRRTRPQFTGVMQRIISGETKCVTTYSLDRLWRSAKIAGEAIDILVHYGCLLVDRNGIVDIYSVEGRNAVLANAVAAQAQREHATVAAPRGVNRSRDKGKLVGPANCLGMRNVGGGSGEVRHLPEEHVVVRRIFGMFLVGEDGSGPMTTNKIAVKLMGEQYVWTPDLHAKGTIRRAPESKHFIEIERIERTLKDVRYIGLQRNGGENYPCPALLFEGEPIVPYDTFQAVQDKMKERRSGSRRVRETTDLAGRMRCGICGLPVFRQTEHRRADGTITPARWKSQTKYRASLGMGEAFCTHSLTTVVCDELDAFIDDALAPLLAADLRDRTAAAGGDTASIEARIKSLQRDLSQRQQWLDDTLPNLLMQAQLRTPGAWDEKTLRATEQRMRAEVATKRADLRAATSLKQDPMIACANQLGSIKDLSPAARRDALRSIIRWVAFFPAPSQMGCERGNTERAPRTADNLGSLVFLTSWGAYTTARLYRDHTTGSSKTRIRAATVAEAIGGVADFPNPQAFYRGMERSFEGRAYPFPPSEVTPGYVNGAENLDMTIEEVEVDGGVFADGTRAANGMYTVPRESVREGCTAT